MTRRHSTSRRHNNNGTSQVGSRSHFRNAIREGRTSGPNSTRTSRTSRTSRNRRHQRRKSTRATRMAKRSFMRRTRHMNKRRRSRSNMTSQSSFEDNIGGTDEPQPGGDAATVITTITVGSSEVRAPDAHLRHLVYLTP